MARFSIDMETGGRALPGASVTVYDEDPGVAEGNEDAGFTTPSTIYSDNAMTTTQTQPMTSDQNGEVVFYMASMSQVAIKAARSGWGTRWYRYIDITGSDPI
jgi:hypothetical protein